MKHRITYARSSDTDPPLDSDAQLGGLTREGFEVKGVSAAKEHWLSIGLDELSPELRHLLEQTRELHLRWASSKPHRAASPYNSRTPPGLHVFYTPLEDESVLAAKLCETVSHNRWLDHWLGEDSLAETPSTWNDSRAFDLDCSKLEGVSTKPPILSKRFTSSASSQLYLEAPSLLHLLHGVIANEIAHMGRSHDEVYDMFEAAHHFDADYDAISHALTVAMYWGSDAQGRGWNDRNARISDRDRIEVGVLEAQTAAEPEELSMAGFLATIGEDDKLKPTLFSFPSRHHPLPPSASFHMAFDRPTGLHPTLRVSIDSAAASTPPHPTCSLHAYFTLPKAFFLDRYQFSDALFLSTHGLSSLRALSGATDLEAPVWAVRQWGSAALFELAPPKDSPASAPSRDSTYDVTVPMHLRYLPPESGGYSNASLPVPAVFWACRAEEGTKMVVNPFDRIHLGYDSLFGERTMFYHFTPRPHAPGQDLTETLTVPVLDQNSSTAIESVTVTVVLAGFAWLMWKLMRPVDIPNGQVKRKKASSKGADASKRD